MNLHTVTLIPSGARQSFPAGTLLSDALLDMGVALRTSCGGKGTCGKCGVGLEHASGEVLACRTAITRDLSVLAGQPARHENIVIPDMPHGGSLSLAVDIGTTTVKMSLVDVCSNASFEIASFLNPQRRFGHDVISRIAAAGDEASSRALRLLIRKGINARIEKSLTAMGIQGEKIEKVVFSGNTTMLYLLYGIGVSPLGIAPYRAETRDFPALCAGDLGLSCISSASARALPVLGAFTGADLVGGLALCHGMGITESAFFIDLGTNGELFILDGAGTPYASSCAMGPALEGMNITWGMTADDGAITRILEGLGGLDYRMIGAGEPVGITGTALVDLAAIMLEKGLMSKGGAFTMKPDGSGLPAPLRLARNTESKELELWGKIRLTQKDIRSLQLAKGASLSASLLLLEAAGLRPADIGRVFVAGAFGEHLDLKNFSRLGFIPDFGNARVEFLGNTSLKAAVKACTDPGFPELAAGLRDRTTEVALSTMPGFQEIFIRSLDFSA